MNCPVCKRVRLQRIDLQHALPGHQCERCTGIWISARYYWKWLRQHEGLLPPVNAVETPIPIEKKGQARLCPECGRLLRRYKIWPDIPFYLDRCGHCTSVWFDKDEWAAIQSRGLQDQVHMFFSDIWQDRLRAEEQRRRLEKMYHERFGEEDYARIKEIRAWLAEHPQGGALLAYLNSKDPYRALVRPLELR